jgi:hypothetical protein
MRAWLGLGSRLARAFLWSMPGVATGRADLLVGLAPVAQLRLRERAIALERGAVLDRRGFRPRVPGIRAAVALGDGRAGEQERRHGYKSKSHGSLDID